MIVRMKRLFQHGSFARGAATLMIGTMVAQAIPVIITPLLTRLYSPEDYGLFALFGALVAFLSAAATGRYELAVMLPEDKDDADALVVLSIIIAIGFGLILLLVMLLTRNEIAKFLGHPDIAPWLLLVPAGVFVTGCYNALNYWLNRYERYRYMSINRMLQSGLGGGLQLSMGTMALGAAGLIIGPVIAGAATAGQLAVVFARSFRVKDIQGLKARMIDLGRRYINHPIHLLPAHWIGAAALQVPVFAISILFDTATVGLYALAYRITVLPTTLVANAIGDVYRQRATVRYREHRDFRRLFLMTLGTTAALAVVPTIIIFAIAPELFAVVFGETWRVAGEYARILLIASFFQFVFTPVDKGALIVGATGYIVVWHLVRLVCFVAVPFFGWIFSLSVEWVLVLFVVANVTVYVLDGIVEYRLSKGAV